MGFVERLNAQLEAFTLGAGIDEREGAGPALMLHLVNVHGADPGGAQERVGQFINGLWTGYWIEGGTLHVYVGASEPGNRPITTAMRRVHDLLKSLKEVLAMDVEPSEPSVAASLWRRGPGEGFVCTRLHLHVLTVQPEEEVEQSPEFRQVRAYAGTLARNWPRLKEAFAEVEHFRLKSTGLVQTTSYTIHGRFFPATAMGDEISIVIGQARLSDLVAMYKVRQATLFDHNVRYMLPPTKRPQRVAGAMRATLKQVSVGDLHPGYFTAYHAGVAIVADLCEQRDDGGLELINPYVINGCQSISSAAGVWDGLNADTAKEGLKALEEVLVPTKVIVGAPAEHIHAVSNFNNNQNPIESWQLFSNDPTQRRIDSALEEEGILYERKLGRFDIEGSDIRRFPKTNGTSIKPKELGKAIAIVRGEIRLGAREEGIFADKATHDSIFTPEVVKRPLACLFAVNVLKVVRAGLTVYEPEEDDKDEERVALFESTEGRTLMYFGAMRYLVAEDAAHRRSLLAKLYRRASTKNEDWTTDFYRKILRRQKEWMNVSGLKSKQGLEESKRALLEAAGLGREDGNLFAPSFDYTTFCEAVD